MHGSSWLTSRRKSRLDKSLPRLPEIGKNFRHILENNGYNLKGIKCYFQMTFRQKNSICTWHLQTKFGETLFTYGICTQIKKLKEPIKFKSVGFGQFFKVSVHGSLVHALRLSKLKNDIKIKKKRIKTPRHAFGHLVTHKSPQSPSLISAVTIPTRITITGDRLLHCKILLIIVQL